VNFYFISFLLKSQSQPARSFAGFETPTEVANQASFEEFQQVFALPLSPMKEAMDALFPCMQCKKGAAATVA
jgi:hypothetical protein